MKIGFLAPRAVVVGGVLAAAAIACVGSDPLVAPPEKDGGSVSANEGGGAPTDGGGIDAHTGPPKCSGAPFTDIHIVPELSSDAEEYAISLNAAETTAYFSRLAPPNGVQIYKATRTKRTDPFGALSPFAAVNGAGDESAAALSNDGFSLFVASSTPSSGATSDIFQYKGDGTRTLGDDPPVDLSAALATGGHDLYPSFTRTSELYFSHGPNDAQELWRAQRLPDAGFGPAGPVAELVSSTLTQGVAVESDGLTIFFGSTRGSSIAFDIWTATRPSLDAPFGTPVQVPNLNTPFKERPSWISPDDCRLYFISNRPPPEGPRDAKADDGRDVWVAERTPQ